MTIHPLLTRALPVLAVLTLLATGCGGGDTDESTASASQPTTSTTAAEEPAGEADTADDDAAEEPAGPAATAEEDAPVAEEAPAASGGGSLLITADQTCEALSFERIAEVTGLTIPAGASPFSAGEGSCAYTMDGPTSVYVEVDDTVGSRDDPATPEGLEAYATNEERFEEVERIPDLGDGAVAVNAEITGRTLSVLLGDQYLVIRATGEADVPTEALRTLAEDLIG